jgi:hypothetical protein
MSERTFRRQRNRFEEDGLAGIRDRRVGKASPHRAGPAEVDKVLELYRTRYVGWPVKHFHDHLVERHGIRRSCGWTKSVAHLQVYLDNALVGRTESNAQGVWSLTPDRFLDPCQYQLRVDQVGSGGKVESRAELQFDRRPFDTTATGERAVVMLPGNNLWMIARRTYGEGPLYFVIFTANQGQIRDPNLIYPSQIFILPTQDKGRF